MGILVGGAPSHFLQLQNVPDRQEVSRMITKEAPISVAPDIKDLLEAQNNIKVELAKLTGTLESILYELKRRERK
tara:strand:+ start:158 stop:382 length:225 start_codon:yes stop_codon:yes gene_type:complete